MALSVLTLITSVIFVIAVYLQKPIVRFAPTQISEDKQPTTEQSIHQYSVTYTDKGYLPRVLEIPIGAQVIFHNTSSLSMWTASDPHPSHSDYPEFDAKKAYPSGDSYSFTFMQAGTFAYHNEEQLSDRGVIRVIDLQHPLSDINKARQSQEKERDALVLMLDPQDSRSVYKVFNIINNDQKLSRDCHEIGHDLGHQAYNLYGFSGAMTADNPDRSNPTLIGDICAGGYMHGVLEELFLNQPDRKAQLGLMCNAVAVINRGSCFHGVGHGFMFVNKRKINQSLDDCRVLGNVANTARCFEGAWMEFFWGDTGHAGPDSLGWNPTQPLDACITTSVDAKPACFLYANLGYLRTHSSDFKGAIALCHNPVLKDNDIQYCMKGVGMTMMQRFLNHTLSHPQLYTAGATSKQKDAYYQGLVAYARLSGESEKDIADFCVSAEGDSALCSVAMREVSQ